MTRHTPIKPVRKAERFGISIELHSDGRYLITLKSGKTLWVDCCDLEDICALSAELLNLPAY